MHSVFDDETPPLGTRFSPFQSAHVLVVDDDVDLGRFMADALGAAGHQVRVARSRAEIFESMETQIPEIVVLDLVLEDVDGADVARDLRRTNPDIQFIFVTGLPRRGAQIAREFGAPLVAKPFRLEQLTGAVRTSLAVRAG